MSPRPIELPHVTQGLAQLDAVLATYPELREPAAQARLTAWLAQEQRMAQQRSTKKRGNPQGRARVQRLREKRKQAGWRQHEIWLDPDTVARVARVKQPSESLHSVIRRALLALEAGDVTQGEHTQ
jgi:hypothetical protein